jgi:CDP-diacylglycerol--serine O-phosphatidyltransferase
VLIYTLAIAFLMVSTIPTFSGKLLGERISREYVLPMFMFAIGFVALLVTYPFGTLTGACLVYLATIPISWRRYSQMLAATPVPPAEEHPSAPRRVVAIRGNEPPR